MMVGRKGNSFLIKDVYILFIQVREVLPQKYSAEECDNIAEQMKKVTLRRTVKFYSNGYAKSS